MPEKYVFRVCFESPFMRMISSLKIQVPYSIIFGYCQKIEGTAEMAVCVRVSLDNGEVLHCMQRRLTLERYSKVPKLPIE